MAKVKKSLVEKSENDIELQSKAEEIKEDQQVEEQVEEKNPYNEGVTSRDYRSLIQKDGK
jgi:hypothetical protein